jgi:hypothetical protein
MPTTNWQFLLNGSTDFTSSVLSANIRQGREKYLDNYAGGSLPVKLLVLVTVMSLPCRKSLLTITPATLD